jgi:hypothetical protein
VKYILKILILYCLLTPLFAQSSMSFSIGSEYYEGQTNYKDVSGIALTYMRPLNNSSEWGAKFNYSTMSYAITAPSVNETVNTSSSDFYLVYAYKFATHFFDLDLKPVVGAGLKILKREAFYIDLGAFGEQRNPPLSKTYFSSFMGLILAKNITDAFGFFLEPGYALYDLNKLHNTFSIRGGIHVAFN